MEYYQQTLSGESLDRIGGGSVGANESEKERGNVGKIGASRRRRRRK